MRTLDRGLPDALQMPFVRSAALRRHLVSHLRPESMCSTIMCRPGLQTRLSDHRRLHSPYTRESIARDTGKLRHQVSPLVDGLPVPSWSAETARELANASEIRKAVLSVPHDLGLFARQCNDEMAALCATDPLFAFFAALPDPDVDIEACIAEVWSLPR